METEQRKPDEMTDDEWLEAMQGGGTKHITKREALMVAQLRQVLSARHAFIDDLVLEQPEKTITQIRERLLFEGLMYYPNHRPSFFRRREKLGIIAFSLALAGIVALFFLPWSVRDTQWAMKPLLEDNVRGISTSEVSRAYPETEWLGSQVQMVSDLRQALVDWEADLVAAGLDYVLDVDKDGQDTERHLHIKLSENIRFLTAEHQRIFAALPRSGEWVLILRKTEAKQAP